MTSKVIKTRYKHENSIVQLSKSLVHFSMEDDGDDECFDGSLANGS